MPVKTKNPERKEKKLRIGILGAGAYAAAAHIPALHRFTSVEVVAACRSNEDRLEAFCDTFKIPGRYTRYREMLKNEDLDGVIIASPNYLHHEHTMACLKKGIPVLIEKPMTITSSDALEIHSCAEKKAIPVVLGYNRHYWANFCYTKKMIEEEQLGEIRNINVLWLADVEWALARKEPPASFMERGFYKPDDGPNFRGSQKYAGGGMLIDRGSNMFAALLWLMGGRPTTIFAKIENRGFETDCDSAIVIVFESKALCSCTVMGRAKTYKTHQISLHGTKGSLYLDDYTVSYQLNGEKEVQVVNLPADSCPTANFIHVLQHKENVVCGTRDGVMTTAVVEAAYLSQKEGKPVSLKGLLK